MRNTIQFIVCVLVLLHSSSNSFSSNAIETGRFHTYLRDQQGNVFFKSSPTRWLHYFRFIQDNPSTKIHRKVKRQAEDNAKSDFTWKVGKTTPQFVTTKLNEQNAKPTLKVYPPDVIYRTSRARELVLPQRNGLTRVIYYAPLPEVTRYPLDSNRRISDYAQMPVSLQLNQHRSFDPTKAGKDFVTRVQSSIIDVRPRNENKKEISSTPTFTIIDANPTPHPVGLDRIMYPDMYQNMIPSVEKDRHMMAYPYQKPFSPFKQQYPVPYYVGGVEVGNNIDKSHYLGQYQFQPQTSPFYHEVEKINLPLSHQHQHNQQTTFLTSSYYSSSPYPTRHNRFPPDRYPLTSSLPFTSVEISQPSQRPSTLDIGENYPSLNSASFGIDSPSTHSSLLSGSNFDFGDNLSGSLDHSSLDLENHNRPGSSLHPLSFKNKFADYGNFVLNGPPIGGQKYTDFNGFNSEFSFKPSLKPQFPQVSDWLTNKPSMDLSSFELEDFNAAAAAASAAATGGQDYHIKGSLLSNSAPTSLNNQSDTTDSSKDVTNTILTPFTSSFSNSSVERKAD
ncbi:hypothetical protein PGB90_001551 [Kerria lacca]